VDPAVPPAGVLASQPSDQCPDAAPGRWAAGLALPGPGGPAAADDVAVPEQDRVRVTGSRRPRRRAFGITLSRVASRARSAQFSFGRRGCRRCGTASWWRRIKISAVFHISSRRDSRSPSATRVIRRNTNRRHTIGDHHGRMAARSMGMARVRSGQAPGWPLSSDRSGRGHRRRPRPAESGHQCRTPATPTDA
jgi:hypothetical protein